MEYRKLNTGLDLVPPYSHGPSFIFDNEGCSEHKFLAVLPRLTKLAILKHLGKTECYMLNSYFVPHGQYMQSYGPFCIFDANVFSIYITLLYIYIYIYDLQLYILLRYRIQIFIPWYT